LDHQTCKNIVSETTDNVSNEMLNLTQLNWYKLWISSECDFVFLYHYSIYSWITQLAIIY